MTNIATIEDILESILGLVLGGAPGQYELATSGSGGGQSGKSSINDGFRPAAVKGPGFWMIAQTSTLSHVGDWAPEYDKDAVTFYRWRQHGMVKDITRLTVWVGVVNRDNDQGQQHNTTDPNATVNGAANPVIVLGNAWELIHNEIPQVAGVGTSFDPNAIEAVREILGDLTTHAMNISGALQDEMAKVNTKSDDFKGSAEAAWFHRVENANHYLSDIHDQFVGWDSTLSAVETEIKNFVKALVDANNAWFNLTPTGVWQHPYRMLAAMFNGGKLDFADLHDGVSDAWDLGTQYADADSGTDENNQDNPETLVVWTPPSWTNYKAFNAFDVNAWNAFDSHLRTLWADNLINSFAPVLPAAQKLVQAFADARNPMMLKDPEPVPPLPMPNTLGMPNGTDPYANYNPYANLPDPFANWTDPYANMGNPFANWGDPFANMGDPFANWGNPFANSGLGGDNPFANTGGGADNPFANTPLDNAFLTTTANPFANTPGGDQFLGPNGPFGGGGNDPFANDTQFGTLTQEPFANVGADQLAGSDNPFGGPGGVFSASTNPFANDPTSGFGGAGGPQTLGDLTPSQLQQLDQAGLLDDTPLTPDQAAYLSQHGLGVPGGDNPTLGDLTPDQLNALQQGGLLDGTPLTDAQRAALGLGNPQSLADLSPAQLQQLDQAGLLNNTPLTPDQISYLGQHGLGVPGGPDPTLGDLSPDQLNALQQSGLLAQDPLTGAEQSALGLTDPSSLADLTPAQLHQLDAGGLLDNTQLTPDQAAYLNQHGLGVPAGSDPTLGQLSQDQLDALQHSGLLNEDPLTAAERAALGLPAPGSGAGFDTSFLGGPTSPVATDPFPTTVNGVDVNPGTVGAGTGGGLPLGDVSQPGAASFPDAGVHVGTGGLSSVPGVGGGPGALSQGGLGAGVGSGIGGGIGSGVGGNGAPGSDGLPGAGGTAASGIGGTDAGLGGMPYMPGMFGGAGGGRGGDDRERQRTTWLKEDEKVWGTDPDVAPAVIGRRGRPTRADDDGYDTPADERTDSREERRPYRGR